MKVIISGGGTAGHINPGLAIARYIKRMKPDAEILFVGTERGLETKLVPRENFEIKMIKVRGFRRKLSLDTLVAVKELFQGLSEARKIIKDYKPDLVIGTGGYVCGPVLFNASRLRIPTLIHEQNAFPGVTNKILSKFVDRVAISFKDAEKYFKDKSKVVFTGNPIRSEMLEVDRETARKKLGISKDVPLVVIFGGSRGAENINSTVAELIKRHKNDLGFHLIYATGEAQYEGIMKKIGDVKSQNISILPYIFDMANTMAAADLAVCRAGAITISELTALGVPSILIPSPYVTANHQEHNARALEQQGASVVILEKNLRQEILYEQITTLLKDKDMLSKMAQNAKKMGITNATEKIFAIIKDIMKSEAAH
ncbi:undecaprenyldiphospho-muramoylpentapeptide beta-N-acetylglucosaminyltransferase [Acetivibrio mesophilus]|uniref:UDP-N-acetylglucosamine--N-acetylmuramyl-(pentapeptide) pyrophosphoryl-undecaprenol N-acetylglucosamine transferase n=1 Tax=Acetivibrio mesophilus TaxID=2487273 RepID=A0A4V1K2C4_9FIRM|nr:undecaprenyldiphospho-muramoylpentapeptide beta-N-acetylglucosaminyltransferase [Acetivibrio mesophilus]ODM25182.1 undecaprenyldiphospho-muramoylpentapeptide beta-N-acetylglucosaminyltransferase [Clostridium sp. Bc-iso-3]RXE59799.1 undecaprenyldiphospho-muramoylpentapeptide beta-N-acetylglucosaminyltransferase [Acetivibrio mesophilus]